MRGWQWTVGYVVPALALALASAAPAQEKSPPPTGTARWGEAPAGQPTGSLSGLIEDLPGLPPGATVTVRDRATGASRSVRTDGGGRWAVTGLPVDRVYTVVIEASCFAPVERNYRVAADQRAVDVSLEREAPVLPTIVKGLGGETVRDAQVTFSPGRLELRDLGELVARLNAPFIKKDGPFYMDKWMIQEPWTFNLGVRADTYVTDDGGMAKARVCVTEPGDEASWDALLEEAGWKRGSDGRWHAEPIHLRVSAPDYFPSETDVKSARVAFDIDQAYKDGAILLESFEVFLKRMENSLDQGPGVWIGPWGGVDSTGDLDPTSITDNSVFLLDDQPVDETSDTIDPGAYSVDFANSSSADRFGVEGGASFLLFGGGVSKALLPAASQAPPSDPSGGSGITSFTAGVARSSEELEYDKLDDTTPGGRDTKWKGTGTVLRAGVVQSLRFGRTFLLRFGYEHERLLETDVTRSPAISAPGGRVLSDRGRLSRGSHALHATFGWSGRHLSPWAGVRLSWQTVRLTGEAAAEYGLAQGLLEQRISFVNEFEANRVLAEFGLDVRIPRTRLFVRAQGATNGSDLRLGLSASHVWLRAR